MNIKGQGHSLTFVEGHLYSTFSNFFSIETARPIEAKVYMEPASDEGKKVNANDLCHMTKMAACPYIVKIFKKSSSLEPKG